jgi:putative Mg2+ transporter-C (MgtC) family protein
MPFELVIPIEDIIKLLLSVLIGGLIGAEREFRDKAAGFRTMILICFGATLFTMYSPRLGATVNPDRIAASIVSGVGFLGAGTILRSHERVRGLTTASTIWLAAALGMGVGGGEYLIVTAGTLIILVVLWVFPFIEGWIDRGRMTRTYRVTLACDHQKVDQIGALFKQTGLKVSAHEFRMQVSEEAIYCTWEAYGRTKDHDRLLAKLMEDAEVLEVGF